MFSKTKWLILFMALSLAACNRGPNAWENFKHKYADKGTTIRLNGVMRLGLRMFAGSNPDPETHALMNILKKMKGVEITIIPESQANYTPKEIAHLTDLLNRSRYESMVNVRKGNQMLNLWVRGDKDTFSDPLALFHDGNDLVMVEMKGILTTGDLQTITNACLKYVGD